MSRQVQQLDMPPARLPTTYPHRLPTDASLSPSPQCHTQKLEQLDLSFNSLTGSLPSSWASMTSLQQLWADVNKLTGPLPASWADLTSLQKLVCIRSGRTSQQGKTNHCSQHCQPCLFFVPSNWHAVQVHASLYLNPVAQLSFTCISPRSHALHADNI